jgi:nucleoid-associated protein YgaU
MEEREEAANAESPGPVPPVSGRPPVWFWGVIALLAAAIVGTALGVALGSRQGGPLSSQTAAGARPTIVVSTAGVAVAPSASVVASPSPVATPSTVEVAGSSQYVVKPGDTLRSIAQDQYGDASQWPRIYDANRDVIGGNPDTLNAGTTLQIPR